MTGQEVVWLVSGPVVGILCGFLSAIWTDRRRRRREARHVMRFRLLDETGLVWFDTSCSQFAVIYKYGFPREKDVPPAWAPIEQIGRFRLEMRPAAD